MSEARRELSPLRGDGDGDIEASGARKRHAPKPPSTVSVTAGASGGCLTGVTMDAIRLNAMTNAVHKHNDAVAKILLSSKESAEKKAAIESAFRYCKEAFMELTMFAANTLKEKSEPKQITVDTIRRVVLDALEENERKGFSPRVGDRGAIAQATQGSTYASVAAAGQPKVHIPGGRSVDIPPLTSFYVVPNEKSAQKLTSSQATKEALSRVFKPSECGLKVNKILNARNNGIRIDAVSPDLNKIKNHLVTTDSGLSVVENIKLNPRIIVHGVPAGMSSSEISSELIAQNLDGDIPSEIKVVYKFPTKPDRRHTSCILEISPDIRNRLFRGTHIYLRFSACRFADHVRILQCFKCAGFGHLAKECKHDPACGHCSEEHERRECPNKDSKPRCVNGVRTHGHSSSSEHGALDTNKCPILAKRIRDKITITNYG